MNDLRLRILTLVAAVVLGFAVGPLERLEELPDGALTDGGWWQATAEDSIRSGAAQTKAVILVVASALGIDLVGRARSRGAGNGEPGTVGPGGGPPA